MMTVKNVVEELDHVNNAIKHLVAATETNNILITIDKKIAKEIIDFLEDYRELIYAKKVVWHTEEK